MPQSDPYELLVIEQAPVPIEEELRSSLVERIRWRREEWNEEFAISSWREPVDPVLPIASPEPGKAFRLFDWLEQRPIPAPTLAILPASASPEILTTACRLVDDFVLWPFRSSELRQRVVRVLGERRMDVDAVRDRLNRELGLSSLIGADPGFLRAIQSIPRIAANDGAVLITGETGTGKELCARAIHHLSGRRNFPFVPVDCAAFPEQLLENEIFGHARGAFTDARGDQKGLAALAEGGTLFLDEIDALSLPGQAKLLRFLEDHVYRPLGCERFSHANVRIVAATNRDLETGVQNKEFRADLFFRLNVFRLRLVPLRERPGDIAILAQHFLERLSAGRERKSLSPAALRRLTLHDWPGNVRELRNEIQRACAFTEGCQILPSHVSVPVAVPSSEPHPLRFRDARARAISEFEKAYVEEILGKHNGNITRAAREAGKERRAFGRLAKKHQIRRPNA